MSTVDIPSKTLINCPFLVLFSLDKPTQFWDMLDMEDIEVWFFYARNGCFIDSKPIPKSFLTQGYS